jgi:DNA-binding NtrC family response regulator
MGNIVGKQGSVIIVDDDSTFLDMVKAGLSLEGYSCESVTSPTSALELINTTSCDIMITDIDMPDMNGLELTRKVKRIKPDMDVIIMTGFIDNSSYGKAIEAGASDFIKKPFTLKELALRINTLKSKKNCTRAERNSKKE